MATRKLTLVLWPLLMVVIIILSVIDARTYIPEWFRVHDKVMHLVIFFIFFLYTRVLFHRWPVWFTLLFAALVGLLTETLQLLFTNGARQFDMVDVVWNIYGILLAWIALGIWRKWIAANLIPKR